MNTYDLVIRGGNLIDGSGSPAREADVAIKDGLIAAVSENRGGDLPKGAPGQEEIDARGLLVTPGFVDLHTHYDGHVTWENRLQPSSSHGVTTAVIGNCGVGFAPCKREDRETLIRLMDGVEDIPFPVLAEGLPWTWESYPEYLDVLASRQFDLDVAGYLPHAALRVFAMGERAVKREAATKADIQLMCAMLSDALDAGAMGIATSRTLFHRSSDGQPIPTLDASDEELVALATTLKKKGRGIFQIVEDVHEPGKGLTSIRRIAEASGRPVTFSIGTSNTAPYAWPSLLAEMTKASADGLVIKGQVMTRAIGMLLGPELTLNPFFSTAGYLEIASLPLEARLERLRDSAVRSRILTEPMDPDPALVLARMVRDFDRMFVLGDPPDYEQSWEQSIAGMAKQRGTSPEELAYDLMIEGDRGAMLYVAISNYADGSLDAVGTLLNHPDVLPGLGDGGAHAATICDGSYSTFLLTHWGRDRKNGRIPLPNLIHGLTRAPALTLGLQDRGLVKAGFKADLNIIDFDRLSLNAPQIHHDLPGGGTRLLQSAEGFVSTIVSGVPVSHDGEATGALAGRLVRGPQETPKVES